MESGKIRFAAHVNVEAFPDIFSALIGIEVSKDQEGCLELFAEIPNVLFTINTCDRPVRFLRLDRGEILAHAFRYHHTTPARRKCHQNRVVRGAEERRYVDAGECIR